MIRSGFEVVHDLIGWPRADADARIPSDVGNEPVLQDRPLQIAIALVAAEGILGVVSGSAMAEAIDQIGAAVAFKGRIRIRMEWSTVEVEQIPAEHQGSNPERKRQLVGYDLVAHGLDGREVGANRQHIVARHAGLGHAGDMPDLHIPPSGSLEVELVDAAITIDMAKPNSVFHPDGTAVVIHGGKDDYMTDPAGNSGNRIACGVISQDPTTVGRMAQ